VTGTFATIANPGDLVRGTNGDFYVSNQGSHVIEQLSPTGADLGMFASLGANQAVGLAFGADGDLYAAYRNTDTIEEFSPNGTDLGAFATTGVNTPTFIAFAAVPEPAAWALAAGGVTGVVAWLRRRRPARA
jgi:hypothetical protein